jgi:hypothetical protein
MTRFLAIWSIFLIFTSEFGQGETNHLRVVPEVQSLDQERGCQLAVRKVFDGDTDRGTEATLHNCDKDVQRIEVTFGLSRKDLIFRFLLANGAVVKAEVLERKFESNQDGEPNFDKPLQPSIRGILRFDGMRFLSISQGQTLDITEKNKTAKAQALINLLNAARSALLSREPHPEFESVSFLTGIFGKS